MKPPNADRAIIDAAKLHGYLLSATHPVGRFKARIFGRLGYGAGQWGQLEADLRSQHLPEDARLVAMTEYGQKYEIRAILTGPIGQADLLVSVWFVRVGEDSPRFVTASGRTQALVTMKETDVRAVADNDLVAVRQATIRGDLRLRVR